MTHEPWTIARLPWPVWVTWVAMFALAVAAVLGVWVFFSAMEAAAFNRATGANVSTWDAMFIELRVQEGPR